MTSIYIDEQRIEIDEKDTIVISIASNNLHDIQSRQGSYSNTFKIPATNRIKKIFENAHILTSSTKIPYGKLKAKITHGEIPIITGFAYILSSTEDYFEISIVGNNSELYESIRDLKLSDLEIDELNHIYTAFNINNARINNTTWESGYTYPNAEYGRSINPSTNPSWYILYPAFYCKYLLNKMFKKAGLTPLGEWWEKSETLFPNTLVNKFGSCIPLSVPFRRNKNYNLRNSGKIKKNTPITFSFLYEIKEIFFENVLSYPKYGWQIINPNNAFVTILDAVELSGRLTLNFTVSSNTYFFCTVEYTDKDGNSVISTDPQASICGNYAYGNPTPLSIGTYDFVIYFSRKMSQSKLRFFVIGTEYITVNSATFEILNYRPLEESEKEFDEKELEITIDFPFVTADSLMPDLKALDLFKFFVLKENLIFNVNNIFRTITINYFENIYQIEKAVDWSNKLDLSMKPTITYKFGDYGKKNIFTDVIDDNNKYTKYDKDYNTQELLSDNEKLEEEVVVAETAFSMVKSIKTINNFYSLGYVPLWKSKDLTAVQVNPNDENNFEQNTLPPYIGQITYNNLNNISYNGLSNPSLQPNLRGYRLTWLYLLRKNYSKFIEIISYPVMVKCLIKLTQNDINNIDFSKPIWIDYFESYFYINSINEYSLTEKKSTEVELIKLQIGYK